MREVFKMATTKFIPINGTFPSKYIQRKARRMQQLGLYHRAGRYGLIHADMEQKGDDFVVFSEPDEEEDDEDNTLLVDGEESEAIQIVIENCSSFVPPNASRASLSLQRKSTFQKYSPHSSNLIDYVICRSRGLHRFEYQLVNKEYGLRHILTNGMFREQSIYLNNVNKVFSSQWLSDNQIVMGTKCNQLLVYNVGSQQVDSIPLLQSSDLNQGNEQQQHGIHAIEINPVSTLLITSAQNVKDLAVYSLPSMDPVAVGEKGHSEILLGLCWLDSSTFVSGGGDGKLGLWKISEVDSDSSYFSDEISDNLTPCYSYIKPVKMRKCYVADKVRALVYNQVQNEIVALSLNAYVHIWDSVRFYPKMSCKLPHAMDNVCLAKREDCSFYAVGSKSHTTLLDPRTLRYIKKVSAKGNGCSIRSISFHGDILTIGTGIGTVMFYDVRATKYLESTMNSGRGVMLKCSKGSLSLEENGLNEGVPCPEYMPAIYTHCYDHSGTRLFTAGGPINSALKGNYAALWS